MGEITEECGCSVSIPVSGSYAGGPEDGIAYCPMHKAAPAMLKALINCEISMDIINGEDGTAKRPCRFCLADQYDGAVGIIHDPEDCDILEARKAVAQARGQEVGV